MAKWKSSVNKNYGMPQQPAVVCKPESFCPRKAKAYEEVVTDFASISSTTSRTYKFVNNTRKNLKRGKCKH